MVFRAPCRSGGWGWVDEGGEWLGSAPHTCAHAHMCRHTHACTCMRGKHDNFMQMAAPLGEAMGIPYDVICACMCMCMCACMCMHVHVCVGHPLTTTTPTPLGGTPGISQNSIALELIKIFQFCLKI